MNEAAEDPQPVGRRQTRGGLTVDKDWDLSQGYAATWPEGKLRVELPPPGSDPYKYRLVNWSSEEPSFQWAADRLIHAVRRLTEIEDIQTNLDHGVEAHARLRARRDDPTLIDFEEVVPPFLHFVRSDDLRRTSRLVSALASEALHHIRSALDYCIYHASWAASESGDPLSRTQFPICASEKQWKDSNRFIRGLTQEQISWVNEEQPYMGTEWTGLLGGLSNRDKHRLALDITPSVMFDADLTTPMDDSTGNSEYIEYPALNLRIEFLMRNALPVLSELHLKAIPTLKKILIGSVQLVNKFLNIQELPNLVLVDGFDVGVE